MERNQIPDFSRKCSFQCINCTLSCSDNTITNPYNIANTFTNYIASIAETAKNK